MLYHEHYSDPEIRAMSEDARNLLAYLKTSAHTTMIGCFRLPDGYVCEDLQWSVERVSKGFDELSRNGFVTRDDTSKWIVVHRFLDENPLPNPNTAKAAFKLFCQIPNGIIRDCFGNAFCRHIGRFPEVSVNGFETIPKLLAQPYRNQEQEQDQDQDQNQDQSLPSHEERDVTGRAIRSREGSPAGEVAA
ncbi:hypothetical protein ACFQU1_20355 [Chelatococcus sp. GCM10030263]|uniref:hypothetical protein n=1 Tax=Chelatococcus sp. GCM10030263 TaxID=3273387 RepID=UPI00361881C6